MMHYKFSWFLAITIPYKTKVTNPTLQPFVQNISCILKSNTVF